MNFVSPLDDKEVDDDPPDDENHSRDEPRDEIVKQVLLLTYVELVHVIYIKTKVFIFNLIARWLDFHILE